MIGIKYLHEFAHFIYARYGRQHLLTVYGVPLEQSLHTPMGILRGDNGNHLEEQMLGFVLSHAGHANIPMDVSDLYLLYSINLCSTDRRKENKNRMCSFQMSLFTFTYIISN